MKPRSLLYSLISLLFIPALLTACGGSFLTTPEEATPTETEVPSPTPTFTETPFPTRTPAPRPTRAPVVVPDTPVPSEPRLKAGDKGAYCRFGPSENYAVVGSLAASANVRIYGRTVDGNWLQITNSSALDKCWISAAVVTTSGDLSTLPLVRAPSGLVTGVTIKVSPKTIKVPGCAGSVEPISLEGSITVNGPVDVTWHFETGQGGSLPAHSTSFSAFGSQSFTDINSYTPQAAAGTYPVTLVIDSPNSLSAGAKYEVQCP